MERPEEALAAWRALACPNRFPLEAPPIEEAEPAPVHPAFGAQPARGAPAVGGDPYLGCRPLGSSELLSEVWLRIGEHHFDASLDQLGAAISAYERVARDPSDPLYSFGLYKLAWSHYRASRFAEAVEGFGRLVAFSDERRAQTGRAGSELRAEALQYVAIALAYEDWNEDGVPDPAQGAPGSLARAADRALVPDAPWSAEALRRLGDVLFEEARYEEAIGAWREALARAPGSCDAPDVVLSIARAHRRLDQADRAFEAISEITDLADRPGAWASCDAAQRARIERIAERALAGAAAHHHQRAQALRAREDSAAAGAEYARAAQAYRAFLARFPSAPASYQVRYDLAEALYWSARYDEAAAAYQAVVSSNQDDRLLARAARRVVESHARALELAAARGEGDAPGDAGGARGRRLHRARGHPGPAPARDARARGLRALGRSHGEGVRDAYAFNNASMLYRYGFWPEARERFTRPLRGALQRTERVARGLRRAPRPDRDGRRARGPRRAPAADGGGRRVRPRRRGSAGPAGGHRLRGPDPRGAGPPLHRRRDRAQGARRVDRRALRRRRRSRAEQPRGAAGARGRGARLLLEQAGRPADAERVYQRLVDELPALAAAHPERRAELDRILADAHYGLARVLRRTYEVERALAAYAAVTDSARFARSSDPEIVELRRSARWEAAALASEAGLHARAAEAWARAARELPAEEARLASLRAAEERLAAGDARTAARETRRVARTGERSARGARPREPRGGRAPPRRSRGARAGALGRRASLPRARGPGRRLDRSRGPRRARARGHARGRAHACAHPRAGGGRHARDPRRARAPGAGRVRALPRAPRRLRRGDRARAPGDQRGRAAPAGRPLRRARAHDPRGRDRAAAGRGTRHRARARVEPRRAARPARRRAGGTRSTSWCAPSSAAPWSATCWPRAWRGGAPSRPRTPSRRARASAPTGRSGWPTACAARRSATRPSRRTGPESSIGPGAASNHPWPRTRPRPRSIAERARVRAAARRGHASTAACDDAQISRPPELRSDPRRMKRRSSWRSCRTIVGAGTALRSAHCRGTRGAIGRRNRVRRRMARRGARTHGGPRTAARRWARGRRSAAGGPRPDSCGE
ncbi:MAG: tetratricopeptide repeat protein [Sandaracinaceae bacterium]|nr:tetratricopeptide repeat protein [Sandaracinaceae bacterium]